MKKRINNNSDLKLIESGKIIKIFAFKSEEDMYAIFNNWDLNIIETD